MGSIDMTCSSAFSMATYANFGNPILDKLGFSKFVDSTKDSKEIMSPIHVGMRELKTMTQPKIYLHKLE